MTTSPSPLRRFGVLGTTGTLATGSLAAMLTALAAPAAAATTYTVDDASDGVANASDCTTPVANSCSLRDAAAAAADGDTIVFAAGLTSITTTLAAGGTIDLPAVTLTGPGSSVLTIDTDFSAGSQNLFSISGTGDVRISGLKLTTNRIFVSNTGDFTVEQSILADSTGDYGGALYANNTGDVFITDSVLSGNTAYSSGGGAYLSNDGAVTVTRSSIVDNDAQSHGGGLYIGNGVVQTLITDSTFTANTTGTSGGGLSIAGSGAVTIANTTISGNSASDKGGALYSVDNDLYLFQSTITRNSANSGGGLYVEGTSAITLTGTILAGNTSGNVAAVTYDDLSGNGNTVDSKNSILGTIGTPDSFTLTDLGGTIRNDDPEVEALADNGGPTMTMALMATSPAIDAGPDPVPTFPGNEYDQRGPGYARVSNGRADIGAYEIQAPAPEPEPIVPAFTG